MSQAGADAVRTVNATLVFCMGWLDLNPLQYLME